MSTAARGSALAREFFEITTTTGCAPAALCAPGARIGLAPQGRETGARLSAASQPDAASRALELGGTTEWRISETEHVLMGRVGTGPVRTVAASLEVGDHGIVRYLELRTSRESPLGQTGSAQDSDRPDATPSVRRYFERLDAGDAHGAAAVFAEDAEYSHPPYLDDPTRTSIVRGRQALEQAFHHRGRKPFVHEIVRHGVNHRGTVVEGVVPEVRGTFGSFLSLVQTDADGAISRYLAFYCEPGLR